MNLSLPSPIDELLSLDDETLLAVLVAAGNSEAVAAIAIESWRGRLSGDFPIL